MTIVNAIRTLPGMRETYLRFLATTYRASMDEAKKQGIVLGYSVHETTPRSPEDPNLYLMVTYKNMAAIDREKMRKQLGSRMIREVIFK